MKLLKIIQPVYEIIRNLLSRYKIELLQSLTLEVYQYYNIFVATKSSYFTPSSFVLLYGIPLIIVILLLKITVILSKTWCD